MRRGFKRRRPRVAWLPTFGFSTQSEGANPSNGYFDNQTQVPTDGSVTLDYYPLTFDQSQSEEAQQSLGNQSNTLHDLISGQEYRLRRLLGSLHIAVGTREDLSGQTRSKQTGIVVAAGAIVLKTSDTGAPLGNANPLKQDHATYPWIWHRTWVLCNADWSRYSANIGASPVGAEGTIWPDYPSSNLHYPWKTGPYFDQKTARIIGQESRLFMCIAARQVATSNPAGVGPGVDRGSFLQVHLHYRLLGSLRTTMGNRRNSVR